MEENKDMNNELDDLKSLWQSQEEEKSYDSQDIFKMIHRKSVNSIQWLFIITIIEVIIGIGLSIWTIVTGKLYYSDESIQIIGRDLYERYENLSHIGLLGSLIIFGITFYFYRKISSALSVGELMQRIIKFRKYVMWFIFCWILFTLLLFTPLMVDMGANTYLNTPHPELDPTAEEKYAHKIGLIIAIISVVMIILFSALYYGIIYGIFLRRLGKNLKELKSIGE